MTYEIYFQIIKIITHSLLSFILSLLLVPLYLKLAFKFRLGDKFANEERIKRAPIASTILKEKENIPTLAGIIIWLPPIILALFFYLFKIKFGGFFEYLNFLERRETYLPIFALFLGGVLGLLDDILGRLRFKIKLGIKEKLLIYSALGIFFAWWFLVKLNYKFIELVNFRFYIEYFLFFLIFIFIFLAVTLSFNEIDGLDGLFAGTAISIILFFLFVSFLEEKYNLASYLAALLGSLTLYLWFNSYPALFFDGNNGSFSVGSSLAIISFLTGTYLLWPFIGITLVGESGSVILQVFSKKIFKRKIFLSSPVHNHFKAIGMKEPKIVVRFWILNSVGVLIGLLIYLFLKSLK